VTILGDAIRQQLARRGSVIDAARIEKTLLEAGVSSTASRGVPAKLRVRRVRVTGTKRYNEDDGASPEAMVDAPINLDWSPTDGVNGVGSGANLRGKSSVLHFTMWAMTGRCHLQSDVRSWADRVQAEFHIDGVPLYVDFTVDDDGEPAGTVEQQVPSGRVTLGTFSGSAAFESLMGSVMLERLRLDVISVFSQGAETEHAWPSYAAALTVRADQLDPIVGNENTLKTRVLQMFLGTGWAAVDARVATALNALKFERNGATERSRAATTVSAGMREHAEDAVAAAKVRLAEFDPAEPDITEVLALTATASDRARNAQDLTLNLMNADIAHAQVRAHLRAEELRQQAAEEDAVARRLFNGMTPTACPRCSTGVSAERYAAETTAHACSLCSAELVLDVTSDPVDVDTASERGTDEPEDGGVDALEALRAAAADSERGVTVLQAQADAAVTARVEAEAAARSAHDVLDSARARMSAQLELARAEGALESLQAASEFELPTVRKDDELAILTEASGLTKQWVKDDQDPLLREVSLAITALARSFGTTNITAVHLKGNGNMDVEKGGASGGYSGLTNGEKLRIKLAATIALVQIGHRDGVGRHPGLLFVDSPAAEEIPESDLRTMLRAMTAVAQQTELQIVVATTHGPILSEVLPTSQLLVATGTDFVW
jgi:hypothetical protein